MVSIVKRHSLRYPLEIMMSISHLFSVALYYSTCYVEFHHRGISYSRPEVLYYWVYYTGLNAPWVVVPAGKPLSPSVSSAPPTPPLPL